MIDYDELKKAAECQKENMLGPVSMVVGCDTILALLAEHEGQEQRIAELEFDNSNLKAVIDRLHLDYQELESEVASLREDAERYRAQRPHPSPQLQRLGVGAQAEGSHFTASMAV